MRIIEPSGKKVAEVSESASRALAASYDAQQAAATANKTAQDAVAKADEAIEQAQSAANPQITTLAKMEVAGLDLTQATETVVASINTLLPDWEPDGHEYRQGDAFQWSGRTWRVSQDTTSQEIYPPDTSEALYYEIVIAPDGIIVYRPAKGQYDSVRLGELRHYPDADGPVYKSLVDYNAYDPDTVPDNWEIVEEAA